jgi:peptidoglycan/xylan/chitin deacetylase (PgdA/CDA1 family)
MGDLFILVSFDVESPYGEYGTTETGRQERKLNLKYIEQFSRLLDTFHIRRTYFILGDYLRQGKEQLGPMYLQQVFQPNNPLVEIAQHTYSHGTVLPIKTRPDRTPMSPAQFKQELQKTNSIIEDCFGLTPSGVRMPLGYVNGFQGHKDLVEIVKDCNLDYVNADSRSPEGDVCLPFFAGDKKRQPYHYCSGVLEIPAHGWHDTVFSGRTKTLGRVDVKPWTPEKITESLNELIFSTERLCAEDDFYLSLAFHPWSMRLFDPSLDIFNDFLCQIKPYKTFTHLDLLKRF